jgi:hypothetical protein
MFKYRPNQNIMMKKGVAVPYIIAILLGVGVIGLVGYWLFVSGGQFGGSATEQSCRNSFSTWCSQWSNRNSYAISSDGTDPSDMSRFGDTANKECEGFIEKETATSDVTAVTGQKYKTACQS